MHFIKHLAAWIASGFRATRAEDLWRRYAIGFTVMMTLILTANMANRSAIDQGLLDAELVNDAGRLHTLSRHTVFLGHLIFEHPEDIYRIDELTETIDKLEAVHRDLENAVNLPPAAASILFGGQSQLSDRINLFIASARGLDLSLRQGVGAALAKETLKGLSQGPLIDDIERLVDELVAASAMATTQLSDLQTMILGFAVLVLLLEALFIYFPAHLIVTMTLRELRQTAEDLRDRQYAVRKANAALKHAATHDSLTKMPNRTFLISLIAQVLEQDKRPFSLLHIDIDRFRAINDTAGEQIGDVLLRKVGHAISKSAGPRDIVARTGGDEFMVLTRQDPDALAQRLCRLFDTPLQIAGRICQTGLSIGYSIRSEDHVDALSVLSDSELALKTAKSHGRGNIVQYDRRLRAERDDRDVLLAELPRALDVGQILPYFQPQINFVDGSLAGVEVLARWLHPTRGLVPPDLFLPLAAAEGLARKIDFEIWTQAMAQFRDWRQSGLDVPRISLNAAPDTIADPQFVPSLLRQISSFGLQPHDFVIEVLETTFIGSVHDIAAINIDRLIGAGVIVELDDFGTGYTSLSKLIQLKVSGFKLDRSLVQPLPSRGAESIIRAVLALAAEMELHVVAEGVETEQQSDYLGSVGCDIGQGYGIGRPMKGADLAVWYKSWVAKQHPLENNRSQLA